MSSYSPPTQITSVFNSWYFSQNDEYLTIGYADDNYLSSKHAAFANGLFTCNNGLAVSGSITWNGTVLDLTGLGYVSGITPGTATASKALVIDSSLNLSGLNNFTITGEMFMTGNAKDIHIAGIGSKLNFSGLGAGIIMSSAISSIDMSASTLTNSIVTGGGITLGGINIGSTQAAYLTPITPGTVSASKAVVVDSNKDISAFRNLTATNLTGTIQTASQPNITSVGTLTDISCSGNISGTLTTASQPNITNIGTLTGLTSSGTISALVVTGTTLTVGGVDVGSNIAPLVGVTAGTCTASKALVVDSSKNIIGLNVVKMESDLYMSQSAVLRICRDVLTGDLNSTIYSDGIASLCLSSIRGGGQVKVLTNANSSNNCFTINNATSGTNHLTMRADSKTGLYTNTPAYGLDVQSSLNCTSLYLNGTQMTANATELNVLAGITAGAALASKALVLNASKNITGINNLTSNTVITTSRSTSGNSFNSIAGSSQAGIYHLLNSNCQFGTFTINDLEIISGNTAAMTISSFDQSISGITSLSANNLTATNLTGTLQTVAQPNITSVGTLTSITTSGTFTIGSTVISAAEIGVIDGVTAGTCTASKALVVDSSKNITTLNSLTSNYLVCNTAVNSPAADATFNRCYLGGIITNYGVSSVKGLTGNTSPYFGSTNSVIWMENSNASPIEAEINISSGTKATATNRLRFGTCTLNDFSLFTNATERLLIRSSGAVSITNYLQIGDSTDTSRMLSMTDNTMTVGTSRYLTIGKQNANGDQAEIAFRYVAANDDTNALTLGFYGGEKARLTRWGSLLVNSTQNTYSATKTKFAAEAAGATEWTAVFVNTSASNNKCMGFINNSALEVGSITWGTGTTSFNTTSDYRLKKDVEPMTDGLELINRLNPVRYKWINSEESAEGFIAHELQDVLPHCVVGDKDAVYDDGSINPQSVDYGKLTITLVAAIQDLSAENQSLKARLERLEQLSESDNSSIDIDIVQVSPGNKFALKKTKRSNI